MCSRMRLTFHRCFHILRGQLDKHNNLNQTHAPQMLISNAGIVWGGGKATPFLHLVINEGFLKKKKSFKGSCSGETDRLTKGTVKGAK